MSEILVRSAFVHVVVEVQYRNDLSKSDLLLELKYFK